MRVVPVVKHSSRDELLSIGALTDPFSSPPSTSSRVSCKPWTMYYFHKSGFLKDTHRVYMQFSDDGQFMRGRGIDNIGTFFMKGQVDVDIEGFSWHIDKCYLNLSVLGIVDASSSSKLNEWISNEAGVWVSDLELAGWGKSHVQHTGYVASGVGDVMPTVAAYQQVKMIALSTCDSLRQSESQGPRREGLVHEEKDEESLFELSSRQEKSVGGDDVHVVGAGRKIFDAEDRWALQTKQEAELEDYRAFNSNW